MQNSFTEIGAAFIHEAASNSYNIARLVTGAEIIEKAKDILNKYCVTMKEFTDPSKVKDFLIVQLSSLSYEVFSIAFLTNQNKLIAFEPIFRGTVNQVHVYVREVVKRALELNAVNLILAHNHPSGNLTPSSSDKRITQQLIQAFSLFEITVLDHIIVSGDSAFSFAENDLLDGIN